MLLVDVLRLIMLICGFPWIVWRFSVLMCHFCLLKVFVRVYFFWHKSLRKFVKMDNYK